MGVCHSRLFWPHLGDLDAVIQHPVGFAMDMQRRHVEYFFTALVTVVFVAVVVVVFGLCEAGHGGASENREFPRRRVGKPELVPVDAWSAHEGHKGGGLGESVHPVERAVLADMVGEILEAGGPFAVAVDGDGVVPRIPRPSAQQFQARVRRAGQIGTVQHPTIGPRREFQCQQLQFRNLVVGRLAVQTQYP